MRIITHNMLQCHVKNCNSNNFPLQLRDVQLEMIEAEYSPEFLANILPKLDWDALNATALQLGISSLPAQVPENAAEDEAFLRTLHNVILETHLQQGVMICPNCNHEYKIKDGIPNMLLAEHEI
ncbi:hypothetical protein BCR43DRAFT_454668 [Syncephalastrum racemosum]|uniref:Trm112p-domain-containing protein n=1 Tax=Syncephalastrum racemosum TaxID=13706 RepID=A0A1X2HHL7_SYNRA|nr:hypothetical protein BCR43DRAFT_454668 [Syncephalastrum racemosum]